MSCSTSTTVITKDIAIQRYKAHSLIRHTFLLLEDFPQLLQLLKSTRQLLGDSGQLLGLAPQLLGRGRQPLG